MKPSGAGLAAAILGALAALPGPAAAGPREADRLYEEARRLVGHPWPMRLRAYRRALLEARPTDRTHAKALGAIATLLERANRVHAAAAWRARSAALGPERDEARLGRELALARLLREEGDLDAARLHLEAVLELGHSVAPTTAGRALVALAEDARAQGDREHLEALADQARKGRFRPSRLLRVLDDLGVARLEAGDRRGAERALREAETVWRRALEEAEPREASRVARRWLDLDLREALAGSEEE